jgi:hypothetical protein
MKTFLVTAITLFAVPVAAQPAVPPSATPKISFRDQIKAARPGRSRGKKRLNLAGMGPGRQWKAPVGHSSETTEQQFEALKEVEAPVVRCNEDAERKNASLALCCAAFHSGVFEIGLAAGC